MLTINLFETNLSAKLKIIMLVFVDSF
jgi:hypothetical protein